MLRRTLSLVNNYFLKWLRLKRKRKTTEKFWMEEEITSTNLNVIWHELKRRRTKPNS
jgi:hypothetical protein